MKESAGYDKRVPMIMKHIARIASGNYDGFIEVSDRLDEIDGISAGLNQLCDVIRERNEGAVENEVRLTDLLRVVREWSEGRLEKTCAVGSAGDSIDQLARILNRIKDDLRPRPAVEEWENTLRKSYD